MGEGFGASGFGCQIFQSQLSKHDVGPCCREPNTQSTARGRRVWAIGGPWGFGFSLGLRVEGLGFRV